MKQLEMVTRQDLPDYVLDLWSTEEFRASQKSGGYIADLVRLLAKKPLVFFQMTNPDVEWSHFTTWMGAIAHREYANPYIQDLYYLHEFWHAATMTYDAEASFATWFRKMTENETHASTHSEAFVYFVMQAQDLRAKTFDFDLWVDRYLGDVESLLSSATLSGGCLQAKIPRVPKEDNAMQRIYPALLKQRVEVMKTRDPFDLCALQIYFYAQQNVQWSNVWSTRWREVERHMQHYHQQLDSGEELEATLLEQHVAWLTRGGEIPFPAEAWHFHAISKQNKKRQGNELFKA